VIVWLLATLGFVLLGFMCLLVVHQLRNEQQLDFLRLKENGQLPKVTLSKEHNWMLFLSHVWITAQDQAATIKRLLHRLIPSASIFLDVDDLKFIGALETETYVRQSACVLLFLSRGYLSSKNCLREVYAAVHFRKPRVLVWEAEADKGGAPLETLRDLECPADLVQPVFSADVIRWHRIFVFQLVSLKLIAEQMLLASPAYLHKKSLPLVVRRELVERGVQLPVGASVYVSAANPAADAAAQEVRAKFPELEILSDLGAALSRTFSTHFFLYLTKDTFRGRHGLRLAEELRKARAAGMPVLLIHENDASKDSCSFSQFFVSTPDDLIEGGLYKDLAVPFMDGAHREESKMLAGAKLSAHREKSRCCHQLRRAFDCLIPRIAKTSGSPRRYTFRSILRAQSSRLHRAPRALSC